MFSCTYEVDGYCYLFHCQAKRTQYGCSGSMNSCPNLKELYDYSTMDLKDIRRMQNQASKEADAARAAKKSSQKAGKQSDADIRRQIELDRKNDELARKERELHQKELQMKREAAAAKGERIPEDVSASKLRNRIICIVVTAFLWHLIVTRRVFQANPGTFAELKSIFTAIYLALPLAFTASLGLKYYGQDSLFGKTFRGSAFLRTYLATLVPGLVAFYLVWSATTVFLKISSDLRSAIGASAIGIYLLASLPAWWLNHYSLPLLWKKGLKYYIEQGKKPEQEG